MKKYINIKGIPALVQGEDSEKILLAVHGLMSNKEDAAMQIVAKQAISKGYQVISIDLPEHGERKDNKKLVPWVCKEELQDIYRYIQNGQKQVSLFACSIGAYMSMLAFHEWKIEKSYFLSPIVNMNYLIQGMMQGFGVSEKRLEQEKQIKLPIGQTLDWEYYLYAKEHPVDWKHDSYVLWGKKDDMMPESEIDSFVSHSKAVVEKVESEHYFHTEEQLKVIKEWIEKTL